MKKILALTTINNTIALKEAVEKIRKEYGDIVKMRKIYFDDYENPDVPLKPIENEISASDIILIDIRGDIRVGREIQQMLKGKEKTVVVLVAGSQHIFALTKMGKFKGEIIFKPEREKEFNVHTYIKIKRFSELTKKLGKIVPFGMLKDMRNWILAQDYYAEGDAENLKNLILFLLKNYAGVSKIEKVAPPTPQTPYGLFLPGEEIYKEEDTIYENLDKYKEKIQYKKKKPTVGVLLYGGMHFSDTKPIAEALYRYLKEAVNLIFVFSKVEYNIEAINKYLKNIDLFLNLQYFRIHGGPYGGEPEPTYNFFKEVDAPCLIGLRAYETEIKKWKDSKQGINPLEVITLEELKRPRIDVVITICGIFRDTFGTHIELINRAIEMVAKLDESPEKNFINKHYLKTEKGLEDFSLARIFGPSPTEYATSMRTLVESSLWNEEKDLVKSYDDSMSYAYFKGRVEKSEQAFSSILKTVDVVTQERDNTEYEVTDLDHYYEFLGGLSRTVQDKKGEKAEILITDSTEEDVVVEDLKTVIERATRTRTLNPQWLEGMLKHDFHGAKKIKDRVEYLLGLTATTGKVDNWIFDEVADRLIFDDKMRKKLQINNPYAAIKISELLIESEKRGYWKVEEEKLKKLRNITLDMEWGLE